ncbi:hypothetical protein ACGFT2_06650 [Streptomyces sp. NPDC048514]|uniref:hypothetical protein n=1 Tax=Streptomyces sp. NPDC048514 TaxID=3365564 RepID=UPI00371747A5
MLLTTRHLATASNDVAAAERHLSIGPSGHLPDRAAQEQTAMTSTDTTRAISDLLFGPGLALAEALDRHVKPSGRTRSGPRRP